MQDLPFAQLDFAMDWTPAHSLSLAGVGVHTGKQSLLEIHPATQPGLWLRRQGQLTALDVSQVRDTRFCTTVGPPEHPVMTVEHVLAALHGLGISSAILAVDGPEAPILDGSAQHIVDALLQTGIRMLTSKRRIWSVKTPWSLNQGELSILVEPAPQLEISYAIDFERIAGHLQQDYTFSWSPQNFIGEIAPARTFSFAQDVAAMQALGLVKGGSLENALVLEETGESLNGLRFANEPVRHKILDCLGDLALLGGWLQARITIRRGGHKAHVTMVKTLKEQALLLDERIPP